MSLYRLQHSYTASQRTNQELEDKLHTLVICPGGQLGWRCAHRIAGAGTCQGTAILPWARGGGVGWAVVGRGPQCAVRVRTVLMLTLFLFSPRLPSCCHRCCRTLLSGLS